MFRVIWRRRGVRSRGASSNWMDSDPPFATGKTERSGLKSPTNAASQHFLKRKKMQFFVKIAEFSRKFALKNSEKVYEVGVRFSLDVRKRLWKWFEARRRLYSVEVPRELRWRLLKVALFGCISLKILTSLIIFFSFSWGSIQFELALRSRAPKPHQNLKNSPIFEGWNVVDQFTSPSFQTLKIACFAWFDGAPESDPVCTLTGSQAPPKF